MCGILAVAGKQDKELVARLSERMRHRGPDEREVLITSVGTMSHERLSIVDLNTGRQPIRGTRDCFVIHNGEIYNHTELFNTQLRNKYPRRSKSDSEVIVRLYEEYGSDFCNYLDGKFAFVIFDEDRSTFMAARDPFGIKPLYYGYDAEGAMWFASEMKCITDMCTDLKIFPPGHYYTPASGFVKYASPRWETEEATEADFLPLRPLLEKAVEKRLMCDVPFGVLLSGGLDSSLIASITARLMKKRGQTLHTFSIGLSADAPDLVAARKVAEHIGSHHHEFYFSSNDGVELAEKLVWHLESYDVTTLRASVPMYFLTKKISELGIKMVLSGEGADEIFGGYLYFFEAPTTKDFEEETKRRVQLLHTADLLRADKSTMANGVEVRTPMLDKHFTEYAMCITPYLKQAQKKVKGYDGRIEKYVLRKAFDDRDQPYLPHEILWRQKEQFSDGVGYGWIDAFKNYCDERVSDKELAEAGAVFPHNTPKTKEALFIRQIFHRHFPQAHAAATVEPWIPKWQKNSDPSGRAASAHEKSKEECIV